MITSLNEYKNIFFVGIAGVGMSALAQYLNQFGKKISGSDRLFVENQKNDTRDKLEAEGIKCFLQDGRGITKDLDVIVFTTIVEKTNIEFVKAKEIGIPIIHHSDLRDLIINSKRTIAIVGTSGKSSTTNMLFDILDHAGLEPSVLSGAGLVRFQKQGKIGNAHIGKGEWLVIESDESDGHIVKYHPEIGLLLNIDKDHKEIEELKNLFQTFKDHTKKKFIVNASHSRAVLLSQNKNQDFSINGEEAGYKATDFIQKGFHMNFKINGVDFSMNGIGKHNMENALAATTVANQMGIDLTICAEAIKKYEGIDRRNQVIGQKNGIWVIDDYAHNPAKVAAAIRAAQLLSKKVIAWFQPHGYGPTRFLREEFVKEISKSLRSEDEIWMSEIFYAGGTIVKDISAADLINDLTALGSKAYFIENRNDLASSIKSHTTNDCTILLMGARDPTLGDFAKEFFAKL